jgi:hypothetical protein
MFDIFGVLWGAILDWGRGESFRRSLIIGLVTFAFLALLTFSLWRASR